MEEGPWINPPGVEICRDVIRGPQLCAGARLKHETEILKQAAEVAKGEQ